MFCMHCGCKNIDGALFCKECGKKVVLMESDGANQRENLSSTEGGKPVTEKATEKPSVHDRDILYCDSINQMERRKKKQLIESIISSLVAIIVLQLLFYLIYNQFDPIQQLQLEYSYHITPTNALIAFSAYALLMYLIIFFFSSVMRPKVTHEQLHITDRGIWGVAHRDVEFAYSFSEINSITKITKLPTHIQEQVKFIPRDKYALVIDPKSTSSLRFLLLGKEQIDLIYPTLKRLVEEGTT